MNFFTFFPTHSAAYIGGHLV